MKNRRRSGFRRRIAYRYPIYMLLQKSKPDDQIALESWQMATPKEEALQEMEQMAMEEYPDLYPHDLFLRVLWPSTLELEEYDFEEGPGERIEVEEDIGEDLEPRSVDLRRERL